MASLVLEVEVVMPKFKNVLLLRSTPGVPNLSEKLAM